MSKKISRHRGKQFSPKISVQSQFKLYPDLSSYSQILLPISVHRETTATAAATTVDQSQQVGLLGLSLIGLQYLQLLRLPPSELRLLIESWIMNGDQDTTNTETELRFWENIGYL